MTRGRQSALPRNPGAREKTGLQAAVIPKPKAYPAMADAGLALVLLEPSPTILACDCGAAAILTHRNYTDGKQGPAPFLSDELVEIIRDRKPTDRSSVKVHLRLGANEYVCRIYLLESRGIPATQPIVALHMERDCSANDAICEIVDKYHLTDREQEVLRGISRGLATKELAEQMNISPNTVKAFLRLVMIKMGVTKRAGIVARILHNGSSQDDRAILPDNPLPKKISRAQAAVV